MTTPPWLTASFDADVRVRGDALLARGGLDLVERTSTYAFGTTRGCSKVGFQFEKAGTVLAVDCGCEAFRLGPCEHLWALVRALEAAGGRKA